MAILFVKRSGQIILFPECSTCNCQKLWFDIACSSSKIRKQQ